MNACVGCASALLGIALKSTIFDQNAREEN